MTACANCHRDLGRDECVAFISGRVMGDEYTESIHLCAACGTYTWTMDRDVFCGPEVRGEGRPLARERAEELVRIIRRCGSPWDGRCRCPAHLEYFGGHLD